MSDYRNYLANLLVKLVLTSDDTTLINLVYEMLEECDGQ